MTRHGHTTTTVGMRAPLSATERPVWSRVLRPGASDDWSHLDGDSELGGFLADRLLEERTAALARGRERGLDLVAEIIDGLEQGELPDATSMQVLLTAYAGHPAFRAAWLS